MSEFGLSHTPSRELLEILLEFRSSMLRPRAIFDRFFTKAQEEGFTNTEIKILLSARELVSVIPKGSLRYYMLEFGLVKPKNKLSKSTITKTDDNDTEESYRPESNLERFRREHAGQQTTASQEGTRPDFINSERFWVLFEIRIATRRIVFELLIDPVEQRIVEQIKRD